MKTVSEEVLGKSEWKMPDPVTASRTVALLMDTLTRWIGYYRNTFRLPDPRTYPHEAFVVEVPYEDYAKDVVIPSLRYLVRYNPASIEGSYQFWLDTVGEAGLRFLEELGYFVQVSGVRTTPITSEPCLRVKAKLGLSGGYSTLLCLQSQVTTDKLLFTFTKVPVANTHCWSGYP